MREPNAVFVRTSSFYYFTKRPRDEKNFTTIPRTTPGAGHGTPEKRKMLRTWRISGREKKRKLLREGYPSRKDYSCTFSSNCIRIKPCSYSALCSRQDPRVLRRVRGSNPRLAVASQAGWQRQGADMHDANGARWLDPRPSSEDRLWP